MEAANARQVFGAATEAVDREFKHLQGLGHPLAQNAQAHHTHGKVGPTLWFAVRPASGFHIGLVCVELTEMPDHRMAHELGHLHRHARIVQAHDLQAGWQLQLQQGVHACANVEQGLQGRLLVDELLGRGPNDGMVSLGRARGPGEHLGGRESLLNSLHPRLGGQGGKADGDFHAAILSASR